MSDALCTYCEKPESRCGCDLVGKGLLMDVEDLKHQLEAERAKVALLESHRKCATETERRDCEKALLALSGWGFCTPEETYGTNSSWAISDLCRAVKELRSKLAALQAPEVKP